MHVDRQTDRQADSCACTYPYTHHGRPYPGVPASYVALNLGVSENRGTLNGVLIIRILLFHNLGYYIRVPYFRKLPFLEFKKSSLTAWKALEAQ